MSNRYVQDGSFWNVRTFKVRNEDLSLPSKFMGDLCPSTLVTSIPGSNIFELGIKHPITKELEVCRSLFLSYFMPHLKVLDDLDVYDLCSVYTFVDAYFLPSEEDLLQYTNKVKAYVLKLITEAFIPEYEVFQYLKGQIYFEEGCPFLNTVIERINMTDCITTRYKSGMVMLNTSETPGAMGKMILKLVAIFGAFKNTYPETMINVLRLAKFPEEFLQLL